MPIAARRKGCFAEGVGGAVGVECRVPEQRKACFVSHKLSDCSGESIIMSSSFAITAPRSAPALRLLVFPSSRSTAPGVV